MSRFVRSRVRPPRQVTHGDDIKADPTLVGYGAAGVTLGMMTPVSGGLSITSPGVYELLDITGTVTVAANLTSVVIRKCRIRASADNNNAILINGRTNPSATDVQVSYCDIDSGGVGDVVFAGDLGGYTATRCEVHGGGDGFRFNDNATVTECYVHDMGNPFPDPHSDCIQRYSGRGRNLTITKNFLLNDDTVGPVSCIMIGSEIQDIEGPLLIDRNAFSGGSYCLYHDAPSAGSTVTNNHWHRDLYSQGGSLGPANDARSPGTVSGNVFVPDLTPVSL